MWNIRGRNVFTGWYFVWLIPDDSVVVNEVAPRPHNSGHYTMDACYTSQFENHIRAVLGLPLGSCEMKVKKAVMLNIFGSDNFDQICSEALNIPRASLHLYGKSMRAGRKLGHINISGESKVEILEQLETVLALSDDKVRLSSVECPLVGIIMGSDSDLPVMKEAARLLSKLKVPFELTIVSAHRTPSRLAEYASNAVHRGIKVVIAGAGGAAHLPGMVAAQTWLPVIGVPIKGKVLDGVDSLHSIVQMPRGIPVACVAINGAENAGLLAARILSTQNPLLQSRIQQHMADMEQQVMQKVQKLAKIGWENYE